MEGAKVISYELPSFSPYGRHWHRWGARTTALVAFEVGARSSFGMPPSHASSCVVDNIPAAPLVACEADAWISFGMPLLCAFDCVAYGKPMIASSKKYSATNSPISCERRVRWIGEGNLMSMFSKQFVGVALRPWM